MEKNKKLIIVSCGQYSDYRVQGIFSSSALAQEYKDRIPGEDWNADQEIILDHNYNSPPDGHKVFLIGMYKDGITESVEKFDKPEIYTCENAHKKEKYFIHSIWIGVRKQLPDGKYIDYKKPIPITDGLLKIYVWGKDEKHAVKIVNDIRTQLIAFDRWNKI